MDINNIFMEKENLIKNPNLEHSSDMLYDLGIKYQLLKEYDEAFIWFDKAYKLNSTAKHILYKLLECYVYKRDYENIKKKLTQLISLGATDSKYIKDIVEIAKKNKDNEFIELINKNGWFINDTPKYYIEIGEYKKAEQILLNSISEVEQNSNFTDNSTNKKLIKAIILLSKVYSLTDRFDMAEKVLNQYKDLYAEKLCQAAYDVARSAGNFQFAYEYVNDTLNSNALNVEVALIMKKIYLELGEEDNLKKTRRKIINICKRRLYSNLRILDIYKECLNEIGENESSQKLQMVIKNLKDVLKETNAGDDQHEQNSH